MNMQPENVSASYQNILALYISSMVYYFRIPNGLIHAGVQLQLHRCPRFLGFQLKCLLKKQSGISP